MQKTKLMKQPTKPRRIYPTTDQPITQSEKIEKWTDTDGMEYTCNLDTDKPFTWLFCMRKGAYKIRVMRKRTIREVPQEKMESGFYVEREFEYVFPILAKGIRQRDGQWQDVEIPLSSMQDLREIQALIDSMAHVHAVFDPSNRRVQHHAES